MHVLALDIYTRTQCIHVYAYIYIYICIYVICIYIYSGTYIIIYIYIYIFIVLHTIAIYCLVLDHLTAHHIFNFHIGLHFLVHRVGCLKPIKMV